MGKKAKKKKRLQERLALIQSGNGLALGKVKSKCCDKYLKTEVKRCKKCPCFDLIEKLAPSIELTVSN